MSTYYMSRCINHIIIYIKAMTRGIEREYSTNDGTLTLHERGCIIPLCRGARALPSQQKFGQVI